MRHILTSVFLVVLLFPSLALGEMVKDEDLVERDGIHYKKFTNISFTGKVLSNVLGVQGSFRNGKRHGDWVWYHNVRQIAYKGIYKNGKKDGPWVRYYDNGQLWFKGTYKDGKRDGPWVGFLSDGTVWEKYTGTFKNGVKISD